jgi:hypothetical protein
MRIPTIARARTMIARVNTVRRYGLAAILGPASATRMLDR